MYDSKLFRVLKTFSARDWREFQKFLLTKTGPDSEVAALHQYIYQYRRDLDHKKLQTVITNETLFEHKTQKNFLNLMSKLYTYALDYVAVEALYADSREMALHTIRGLSRRGLHHMAYQAMEDLEDHIRSRSNDLWDPLILLRAYHKLKFSDSTDKKVWAARLMEGIALQWRILRERLDRYYLLDSINDQRLYLLEKNPLEGAMNIRMAALYQQDPAIQTLESLIEMVGDNSHDAYLRLYHSMADQVEKDAFNLGAVSLLHLIQYQLRKVKKGDGSLEHLATLFQIGFKTGWLLDNGQISDTRFLLAIELNCLTQPEKISRELMTKWGHTLEKGLQKEALSLADATTDFYYGHYPRSIEQLITHQFRLRRHQNMARELLLMNYVRSYPEDYDFLHAQIKNFADYTRRHRSESSDIQHRGRKNFIRILTKLINGVPAGVLLEDIHQSDALIRRSWLLGEVQHKKP